MDNATRVEAIKALCRNVIPYFESRRSFRYSCSLDCLELNSQKVQSQHISLPPRDSHKGQSSFQVILSNSFLRVEILLRRIRSQQDKLQCHRLPPLLQLCKRQGSSFFKAKV